METQLDKLQSRFDIQSYFEDNAYYEVVARIASLSDKREMSVVTSEPVSSKISELAVKNFAHVLRESDLDKILHVNFGYSLKKESLRSTYSTSSKLKGSFKLLQKWSGYVTDIYDDDFVAIIKDKSNASNPDEEVTISIDELSPSDQKALSVGSEFFWSIGYETNASGSRFRKSEIRLRRLAPFSQEELEYAKEKANKMKAIFEEL